VTNGPGTHGPHPDDLADEVRRRLHAAVSDVRPSSDALERLRAAVPARRRQRRVATFGAATLAALLLAGTPVLRTAVDTDGGSGSNIGKTNSTAIETTPDPVEPTSEGGVSAGVPGTVDSVEPTPDDVVPISTASTTPPPEPQTAEPSATPPEETVTPSASESPTPTPSPTKPPPAPLCQATDLFAGDARLGAVGTDGLAYGVLQVRSNASRDCSVAGPGVVVVVSPPGNPIVQVSVVEHVAGDVATALPEPASSAEGITLTRGQAYEFQFAWQPQPPGADGTCGVDAPPAPVPALGYTLASGDFNVAKVTLTSTCGGTLYRTDIYRTGKHPRVG